MNTLTKIFGSRIAMFFTATGGASISQIGRLQAESKELNDGFWAAVTDATKGVFKEKVTFVGGNSGQPEVFAGTTITPEEIRQVNGVADRNAETAVLMHGLKVYQELRKQLESWDLSLHVVPSNQLACPAQILREKVEYPLAPAKPKGAQRATKCSTEAFMEIGTIDEMVANLNDEVLANFSFAFLKEAQGLNSRAAALGKLISQKGSFFRQLVLPLPKGDRQVISMGVMVTQWEKAYEDESLKEFAQLRSELQGQYDGLQQQLNSCRKQIKDAVREYNLGEERRYQADWGTYVIVSEEHDAQVELLRLEAESRYESALAIYRKELESFNRETERVRSAAETLRQQALQEMAGLRVRTE